MATDIRLSALPWGNGFRRIDRLVDVVLHERIVTIGRISAGDEALERLSVGDTGAGTAVEPRALPLGTDAAGAITIERERPAAGSALGTGALPHSLVLEGIGQSASLLFQMSYGRTLEVELPVLGYVEASFLAPAHAGDSVRYSVRTIKMTSTSGLFEASAEIEGSVIARAELALGISRLAGGRNGSR